MNKGISEPKAKKVAVIAVHGISDQKPFASAREIANLLINPNPDKKYESRFSNFKERFVRFLVKPLSLNGVATDQDQADLKFTKKQLEDYEKTSLYQTICLEGESDDKSQEVHVYEMFWADLSRLGESFFRIFGELYQILFHLSKVGTQTAEKAAEKQRSLGRSNWFIDSWVQSQKFCSYLLSSIIPVLNLYFLIAVFLSIPINIIIDRLIKDEKLYNIFLEKYSYIFLLLFGLFISFIWSKILLFREEFEWVKRLKSKFEIDKKKYSRELFNAVSWLSQFFIGAIVAFLINKWGFSVLFSMGYLGKKEIFVYLITLAWISILISLLWFTLIKSFNRNQPGISTLFSLTGIALLVMLIVEIKFITKISSPDQSIFIYGLIGLGLFLAIFFACKKFQESHSDSKVVEKDEFIGVTYAGAIILISLALGFLLILSYRSQNSFSGILNLNKMNELLATSSLNIIEVIYFCLYVSWFLFIISYLVSFGSGLLSFDWGRILKKLFVRQNTQIEETNEGLKLLRAFGVSIASLILPASLFLFTSLTIWSTLNNLGSRFIYGLNEYNPIIFRGLTWAIYGMEKPAPRLTQYCLDKGTDISDLGKTVPGSDCFLQLVSDFSTSSQANWSFLCFGLVLLLAVWTLFPAILSDIFPPDDKSTAKDSWGLGNWLTNGYTVLVWSFLLLVCIGIPIFAVIGYSSVWHDFFIKFEGELTSSPFLQIPALFLTVSAGTLIALGSTLKKVSLGLRGVLDAALDVDNYLREEPEDDTPKAKIFARYASLLRYICDRPIEDQYDAIIIVAHSQGTVISADLLRYLNQDFLLKGSSSSTLTEEFRAYNAYDLQVCDSLPSQVKYYCEIPQQEFIIAKKDRDEEIYHLHIFDRDGKKVVYRALSESNDEALISELDLYKNQPIDDETKRKLIRKIILSLGAIRVPNIYLFTMGSPIKQLYSFSFPHLYHWVYNLPNQTERNPNPDELLKVRQWVNAYRSGDYVGRYLWHESSCPGFEKRWEQVDLDKDYNQSFIYSPEIENLSKSEQQDWSAKDLQTREFCIGAGGHTHYWDETAPEIAIELDRLIRDASAD